MDGYWWGVLTPFAIILGILLLYLTGNLFGAIVSWAWKKAHYGLLKKGWIAEDYDEDSREWTTRPGAERLALYGPITILRQLFIIRRRHIHWQRSNRQLVTRKSGISNLVEKKTQDMETRIIEVKVRLIGQRNQHELHWRFS